MYSFRVSYSFLLFLLLYYSCDSNKQQSTPPQEDNSSYSNPILDVGAESWAIFHQGKYYYTQGCVDRIILWETNDITNLRNATSKEIWFPKEKVNASNLWGPEIHFIDNKWYVYFAADDGNTDNHQIYVIENESPDPFMGEFVMKGRVQTDTKNNWAIHASVFEHKDELYMIWSGWQERRIETEVQCIYIAKMENPWTLKSERVLLSKPEFEWERQWINPDGSRTAYPIYVNEAPQSFYSKDKEKVFIYYSASGNWTPYYAIGLLSASSNSDLLDPASWMKSSEPLFQQDKIKGVYSPGSLSFIPSPDQTETYMLYHAREEANDPPGSSESRSPRMQKIEWDEDNMPVLGTPVAKDEILSKPSGIVY